MTPSPTCPQCWEKWYPRSAGEGEPGEWGDAVGWHPPLPTACGCHPLPHAQGRCLWGRSEGTEGTGPLLGRGGWHWEKPPLVGEAEAGAEHPSRRQPNHRCSQAPCAHGTSLAYASGVLPTLSILLFLTRVLLHWLFLLDSSGSTQQPAAPPFPRGWSCGRAGTESARGPGGRGDAWCLAHPTAGTGALTSLGEGAELLVELWQRKGDGARRRSTESAQPQPKVPKQPLLAGIPAAPLASPPAHMLVPRLNHPLSSMLSPPGSLKATAGQAAQQ